MSNTSEQKCGFVEVGTCRTNVMDFFAILYVFLLKVVTDESNDEAINYELGNALTSEDDTWSASRHLPRLPLMEPQGLFECSRRPATGSYH